MKRFLTLLLALALVCVPALAFSDVSRDAWYAIEVNKLASDGIITGYPDGTFRPENDVSRAEFAALVARSAGREPPAGEGAYWCAATLDALADALPPKWRDLPRDAGHFEVPITREEAVYLLMNTLSGWDTPLAPEVLATETEKLSDLDTVDPALLDAVVNACFYGVVTGYPDGTFGPKDSLTRAQAAAILFRTAPDLVSELKVVNEWDSGGEHFTQYDLTVTARRRAVGWEVELAGSAEIQQAWSCVTWAGSRGPRVSDVEYNSILERGESATVGFIAKGEPLRVFGLWQSYMNAEFSDEEPGWPPESEIAAYVPVGEAKPLHVEGTHLADPDGNAVQLRGVSTHGLAWFPDYVNEDAFRTLRDDWGANVIRLAMYTAEYGGYCNGGDRAKLKALIDKGVRAADRLGMYVIIDWHILSDGDPTTHQAEAVEFFSEMSKRYAQYENVLYEICNEPQNSPWRTVIKPYAEAVLPAIRQNDPDAIVIVGTNTWSQDVDDVIGAKLDDENAVYAFHFYAATHKDAYRQKVQKALNAGVPVFVSECGLCDASGGGGVDTASAQKWFELLNKNGVSFVAWSLCNKNETASLIRSDCTKLAGWTVDDLSRSGLEFQNAILH